MYQRLWERLWGISFEQCSTELWRIDTLLDWLRRKPKQGAFDKTIVTQWFEAGYIPHLLHVLFFLWVIDGLSNLCSALQLPFCFGNTLLFYCWFMLTAVQLQRISYCTLILDFSARFVEFFVIVVNHIFIFCNLLINEVSFV